MTTEGELPLGARRTGKSESAFRTISEVADELDVPQHVLRFWESKFPQVRPLKRGGGRRYYRPEDVALLRRIRDLLYSEGYTIKGVQKLLREGGHRDIVVPSLPLIEVADLLVSVESPAAAPESEEMFEGDISEAREMDAEAEVLASQVEEEAPFVVDDEPESRPNLAVASEAIAEDMVAAARIEAEDEDEPPEEEGMPQPPLMPAMVAEPAPPAVAAIAAAATALATAVGVPEQEGEIIDDEDEIPAPQPGLSPAQRRALEALLDDLEEMRDLLPETAF